MARNKLLVRIGSAIVIALSLNLVPLQAEEAAEDDIAPFTMVLNRAPLDLVIKSIVGHAKLNVVVDSKVSGSTSITLRKVPWKQALDLVLKTNDLDMRRFGNTLVIAPKKTIAMNFDKGLTQTFYLRYAKAEEVQQMLTSLLGEATAGKFKVHVEKRLNAVVISSTEDMFKRVEDLLKRLDRPVPQVMIDIKIVEVNTDFERLLGFEWNWGSGAAASPSDAKGTGNVLGYTEFLRTLDNGGAYEVPEQASGADLFSFGDFYRQNLFFNAVFNALIKTSDSRVLSSPRLIAMNGQEAELNIDQQITFSGGTDQQPSEKSAGTKIKITPQINNDGFIVLSPLSIEKSSPILRDDGFPTIDSTEVKTTLQVQDGEEILIGGMVEESESKVTQKIPFLSNLPFIKHLFTNESNVPKSKEIVILVTPKVVKESIATSDFGELVADQGGIPNTNTFDPNFENKNNESNDNAEADNDPFGGNDFGDGFDDEFGGL